MQEAQEMKVGFLGREDPLEEDMATHSSVVAMDRGAQWATGHGVSKELDMTEQLSNNNIVCQALNSKLLCAGHCSVLHG